MPFNKIYFPKSFKRLPASATEGRNRLDNRPAERVMEAQDAVWAGQGREVLKVSGYQGWLTYPSSSLEEQETRTLPDPNAYRVVARSKFRSLPGFYFRAVADVLPCAQTQVINEYGGGEYFAYDPSGANGEIKIVCVFTEKNGSERTVIDSMECPVNKHPSGSLGSQSVFPKLERLESKNFIVPGLDQLETASEFSNDVEVEMTWYHRGGVRLQNGFVFSYPWASGFVSPESGSISPVHAFTSKARTASPSVGKSASDTRGGTFQTLDSLKEQIDHLAPMVFQWHGYSRVQGNDSTQTAYSASISFDYETNDVTWRQLEDESNDTWSLTGMGSHMPSPGTFTTSEPTQIGKDRMRQIPVRVHVYHREVDCEAQIRIQTSNTCRYEYDLPERAAWGWTSFDAVIEAPIGADDDVYTNLQVFHRVRAGTSSNAWAHLQTVIIEGWKP